MLQKARFFVPYALDHGLLEDLSLDEFPTLLRAWCHAILPLSGNATHFGYVYEGRVRLICSSGAFDLCPGMYFSVFGDATLEGESKGIVVSRLGYRGFFQVGGPVEQQGRLKYIDGCTDSLLIPPVMLGDPCLNLLYFPPGIKQTQHTHPSVRVGLVIRGMGWCVTPAETIPLLPGKAFLIPAEGPHSFHTDASSMAVVAYHPDSDFGPTHENHPMINRTIVGGVSASQLAAIRTQ